ncbi:MAG: hypothetical protein C0494_05810 [Sphingobium sp.]|nr:hypothetical protein [Sphingobium sp.]
MTRDFTSADRFEAAFTETVDNYRIIAGEEATNAPMPDPHSVQQATEMLVRTVFDVFQDTRLEAMAERIAWGVVYSLHKVAQDIEGQADRAAQNVSNLIGTQDGSEVATLELEEAQQLCQSLDETQDALACMRDYAAETFAAETGRPWSLPRATLVSSKRTASVIAARDYLAMRAEERRAARYPKAPVVIFSGGQVWEDHALIYRTLDLIHRRIPGMVLASSGQDKGCDAIAAAWAARTGCKLISFTLDRKLGKRAGFVRNDQMLQLRPVEAVICEGSGLQEHLVREARQAGVAMNVLRLSDQHRGARRVAQR